MTVTHQHAEKLLTGTQKFGLFAFSMMLTHLKELYAKDPTNITLENCTKEINAYLEKYHAIMVDDFAVIESLLK